MSLEDFEGLRRKRDIEAYLAQENDPNVWLAIVQKYPKQFDWQFVHHANCPIELLEYWFKTYRDEKRLMGAVARHPNTPLKLVKKLHRLDRGDISVYIATRPDLPYRFYQQLSRSYKQPIRENVAKNKATPVRILEELSADWNDLVRLYVASNPSTPSTLVEKLWEDPTLGMGVLSNPNLPDSILKAVATVLPEDRDSKLALVKNKRVTQKILDRLLEENRNDQPEDAYLTRLIISHRNVSFTALVYGASHSNYTVQELTLKKLKKMSINRFNRETKKLLGDEFVGLPRDWVLKLIQQAPSEKAA